MQQVICGLFVLLFVFYFIKAAPFENNMYPYGSQQNDEEFGLEDSPYFYYGHCLRIDTDFTGFPFFSERHYKLYVSIECFKNDVTAALLASQKVRRRACRCLRPIVRVLTSFIM